MTSVPLGQSAYKREYSGAPEVQLLNRWLELNPANPREGSSILARPGTTELLTFDPGGFAGLGSMRGCYAPSGLFNNSLFVVCGANLYRVNQDKSKIQITGTIHGSGTPEVGWQKGPGYEQLWIADGTTLQYYSGTSKATGTVSVTGGSVVNGVDIVAIGGVYYTWGTTFSSLDAGTSSYPYVVNPTSVASVYDPINQLILAILASGTAGTDYSSTITQHHPSVSAASAPPSSVTSLTVRAGGSYTSTPTVTISGGGGTGAAANAVMSGAPVVSITVDTHGGYMGTGYIAATLVGGGGTGATCRGIVYNGSLVSFVVDNGGHGYTSAPLVVVDTSDGGGGTGTAVIGTSSSVASFTVTDVGYGYISTPTVDITGGGGPGGATATANVSSSGPPSTANLTALIAGPSGNFIPLVITGGTSLIISGATLSGSTDALTICPIPGGLTPTTITQVSSYLLVSVTNSQQFYWVNPGDTFINALNFASKESSPDSIVCMRTVGDQVLIMGEKSTENWYATGNSQSPFAPIEGRVYARGALAGTPVVVDNGVVLVSDDGRVYNIGYAFGDNTDAQYGVNRISNNGIEERIRLYRATQGSV